MLLGVVSLGQAGCRGVEESDPRPNLLLISIDTLRADHLGSYGYPRETSPSLDRLADQGVLFEEAVANSPWTLPSHASMLTGLHPRSHGVKTHTTGLSAATPTLAAVLNAAGYETMALVNTRNLSERWSLNRGFERYELFPTQTEDHRRLRSAREQVQRAIDWLEERSPRPFFMLLHNYDVHSDYDPSPEFLDLFAEPYEGPHRGTTRQLKRVRTGELELGSADLDHIVDRYDAGIRELDSHLKVLLDYLDRSGLSGNTVVILTSDHGEEFGDHGGVLHGRTMYRELLHVPLIFRGPGLPDGVRVESAVQLSDIFATVLHLAGVDAVPASDGSNLAPAWAGEEAPPRERPVFAEADHNNQQDDVLRMVRRDDWKLIFNRLTAETELYDLEADPGESIDLSGQDADVAQDLSAVLEAHMSGEREGVQLAPLSEDEQQALEALGYL